MSRQDSFVVSLGKALNGIASIFNGETDSNRWQLDSKTERFTLLSPGPCQMSEQVPRIYKRGKGRADN